jgi:hypothetical protein
MKIIILLLTLSYLSGCNKEKKPGQQNQKDTLSNTQSTSNSNTPQGADDKHSETQSSLSNIEYGINKLPADLKNYEGKIVEMAKWEDKLEQHSIYNRNLGKIIRQR